MPVKAQRIRDPLHNLIEFGSGQFEQALWRVVQTRPFQRLRRVRQLGFSELVYPGATHTRFAHSLGAYHIARNLMSIITRHIIDSGGQVKDHQRDVALAATLVHDVGHGMFSHAFETVGKQLDLPFARHESFSYELIRNSEIRDAFQELGSGFADDVADVIGQVRQKSLYDVVVSSQFDADRLDYMQRDQLMTGVQNGGIDFTWLLNNLEVGKIAIGADDEQSGEIETFVLGPKAIHAAETYVLSLFQLYPTVYFHKTTRGAEKLFSAIMLRAINLIRQGDTTQTGLPPNHPLVRFALEPGDLERALDLDDAVFWGALPMLARAPDNLISQFSTGLWTRRLPKCLDVLQLIEAKLGRARGSTPEEVAERKRDVSRIALSTQGALEEWRAEQANVVPRMLIDFAERHPYKRLEESKGPLDQINIRQGKMIYDIAKASSFIAGIEPYRLFRVYYFPDDAGVPKVVKDIVEEMVRRNPNVGH